MHAPSPPPIIELDDIRLTLTSRAGPVDILRGVSLQVPAGQSPELVVQPTPSLLIAMH